MPIKNVEFKTSSATGIGRNRAGEGLANLVSSSIQAYGQQQKKVKSANAEQDKLMYSDLRLKVAKNMRERNYDRMTGFEQSQFLDEIENQDEEFEFTDRIYNNNYKLFIEDFRIKSNNKITREAVESIDNEVIPELGKDYNALNEEVINTYIDGFKSVGTKNPKRKLYMSMAKNMYSDLITNTDFQNMTKKEILDSFPTLALIKDDTIKRDILSKINEFDAKNTKRLYNEDIDNGIFKDGFNNKMIRDISKKYGKSFVDVFNDYKKNAKNAIELLSQSDDVVLNKRAVFLANQFNEKISKVENSIKGLINSAITDTVSAHNQYLYSKRMIGDAGYIPNEENTKDFNIIQGIGNSLNLDLTKANDFEIAVNFALTKRDNPFPKLTKKEFDKAVIQEDAFLFYDKTGDEISDESEKQYIFSKARELSSYMPATEAINQAVQMRKKYLLGQDKTNYAGIDLINTNEDADEYRDYVSKQLNLEGVRIVNAGQNFLVYGQKKDGSGEDLTLITASELNQRVNSWSKEREEIKRYREKLEAKNAKKDSPAIRKALKILTISGYDPDIDGANIKVTDKTYPKEFSGSLSETLNPKRDIKAEVEILKGKYVGSPKNLFVQLESHIKESEGERGDEATDIPTGAFGVTEERRRELERKYNISLPDTPEGNNEAVRLIIEQDGMYLEDNLVGYSKLSNNAKIAIIDTSYNTGSAFLPRLPKFAEAVKNGNEVEAMKQLLDTATIEGSSSRGLAKRRAKNYNRVSENKITTVEQLEDGTIIYRDKDENIVFQFTARGGRHNKSNVGKLNIGK